MVQMKRMSVLSFQQMLELWNKGFEGYAMDMTMTMDKVIGRFGQEGLSPEVSVVAFDGEKPVGFVLNAIRTVQDKVVAWNGGTGVHPDYRRQGVGRQLMEATLDVYREHGVQLATLEALKDNERAIALYQQLGYKVVDELVFYQQTRALHRNPFERSAHGKMFTVRGMGYEVSRLPFYKPFGPWQTQWQNVRDGESVIALEGDGAPIGYALYKRTYNSHENKVTVSLLQCEVSPDCQQPSDVVLGLCDAVYRPDEEGYQRGTVNLSYRNKPVCAVLEEAGFSVRAEQVYMTRDMEGDVG
jgi:GNAT superfamily N-acetyltransferase